MEENNIRFQAKYRKIEENEVRYEEFQCEDADYLLIAFGSSARICQKVVEIARAEGIKLGLLRPITLWPFPTKVIAAYADKVKGMLSVEFHSEQDLFVINFNAENVLHFLIGQIQLQLVWNKIVSQRFDVVTKRRI